MNDKHTNARFARFVRSYSDERRQMDLFEHIDRLDIHDWFSCMLTSGVLERTPSEIAPIQWIAPVRRHNARVFRDGRYRSRVHDLLDIAKLPDIPPSHRSFARRLLQNLITARTSASDRAFLLGEMVDIPILDDTTIKAATLAVFRDWDWDWPIERQLRYWDVRKVTNCRGLFAYQFSHPWGDEDYDEGEEVSNDFLAFWNTENVTDMSRMFEGCESFDADISGWNTRKVADMSRMFRNCEHFQSDLSAWDTRNVTDMSFMFESARAFQSDLSAWDTGRVVSLAGMFRNAEAFHSNLARWNVARATDMSRMFDGAHAFQSDLSAWDTRSVVTLASMFREAVTFDSDLSRWNVARVTDMSFMFDGADAFASDLSPWETGRVRNFAGMFHNAPQVPADLSDWDTSNATDMTGMFYVSFYNARATSLPFRADLSRWKTGNVTSMSHMFHNVHLLQADLSDWDTGQVKNMAFMFHNANTFHSDLSRWQTSNVTSMLSMFRYANAFDADLSAWKTGNVVNMRHMFGHANSFNSDLSRWNVARVTDMSYMFYHASAFQSDLSEWDTSNVTSTAHMFRNATSFQSDLSRWNTSNVTNMAHMFRNAPLFHSDLSRWDTSQVGEGQTLVVFDDRTDELWSRARVREHDVARQPRLRRERRRFRWQELCDVGSRAPLHVLRRLAHEAGIPSPETQTRRELCAAFSRLWSSHADEMATALPECTNARGLLEFPVADTPPEFFYRYAHDGVVYCDDIRHLYQHVQTSTKNPYTNLPYSPDVIRDIEATYRRLRPLTTTMIDFDDEPEVVSFASNLTRKLADLMSRLYYPNDIERFRGASDVQFSAFVRSLQAVAVISSNDRDWVESPPTVDARKLRLVELLILKIDNDPHRVQTSHGELSEVAVEVSDVYNRTFV